MELERLYQSQKYNALHQWWHFSAFRPLQEEAIDTICKGNDCLVLFPTGAGKSLCYQLPALILEGICLVISPLLALMRDQVLQLQSKGIEASLLSSEMDDAEQDAVYQRCMDGLVKILYVSPERLTNKTFLNIIPYLNISILAVDEAHCISEWGQDFRPSYQFIKRFRDEYKNVPCMALTATATPKVLKEISEKLGLQNPQIFQKSFNRENLHLNIEKISDKYAYISEFLKYNPNSGLIYTRTRKEAEELTDFLKKNSFKNVDFFHAGLKTSEKKTRQDKWLQSQNEVLICTNAFGMGIDKENVRFIIHLSPPSSLENYYQEIGRAGRDGEKSIATLLWNQQELDNIQGIILNQLPNKKEFTDCIAYLYSVYQIADQDSSDRFFQFNLSRIKQLTKLSVPKIRTILNFLHHQEIIYYNPQKSLSVIELNFPASEYESLPRSDAYFIELLLRNIPGFTHGKMHFSELQLAAKTGIGPELLKQRLYELQTKDYLRYIDGNEASIKFLIPRNDRDFAGKWWLLFKKIQKNKLQKWEEMKYFLKEEKICKMKMILAYFGERQMQPCGHCSNCVNKEDHYLSNSLSHEILNTLKIKPATLEQLFMSLSFHKKEKIRETLILLLDSGKVKMLDFRTYTAS